MKCANCNKSVFSSPLIRVNPKGEDGIWWCHECVNKEEPELYKNTIDDMNDVEKFLIKEFYPKPEKFIK